MGLEKSGRAHVRREEFFSGNGTPGGMPYAMKREAPCCPGAYQSGSVRRDSRLCLRYIEDVERLGDRRGVVLLLP